MFFTLGQTWTKAALLLALGLVSCTQSNSTTQTNSANPTNSSGDRTKVVATTSILCDMTQQIAAETIDLTCLLPPGVDAHVYEPVPEDRRAIETAQLILYSGYNLEPDLIKIIKSTSNSAPKIAVAEVAVPKPLMGEEHHHAHEGEEHEEEGEKVPDPHVWQNAQNGSRMVGVIQTNLAQIVPANAKLYTKNARALKEELRQIDSWIKSQIATIPPTQRKIVTTHDALGYYAAAYNIPVEGALEGLSTQEKPTATQVKSLVDTVKETKVPTIFAETVVNPKLIETVAKDAKVKVSERKLFSDSLGEPGSEGDTYAKMLIANTQAIVEGLGGKFTPFEPKSAEASQ